MMPFVIKLTQEIHPLALGNVYRVHELVARLAHKLMRSHFSARQNLQRIVDALTVESYSHLHMIGRAEAIDIFGQRFVQRAPEKLEAKLDALLKQYEDDFSLRSTLFAYRVMGPTDQEKTFRFVGGAVESRHWGYLYETKGKLIQHSVIPNGVHVQIPPGQPMPLIPGAARETHVEVHEQRWHRNTAPEGVTL